MLAFFVGLKLYDYDTQLPAFVTLMLSSREPGTSFRTNMARIQGTVLGMLFGQIFYKLLYYCGHAYLAAKAATMCVCVTASMYIYLSSVELGFVGLLLAVFSGRSLARECHAE